MPRSSCRPKSFLLLRYLVENSGRLVSRDELIKALWPDVIATDESVTRCVSDVRMALGDSAQRIIKTLSKRGYVLTASVFEPGAPSQSDAATRAVATSSDLPSASPGERPAERRQLTVLSCKVVGLTGLSARLDPEDFHMATADCHRYCAEMLHRHRGYLARYYSDGVLAYFGYPQAAEHDAENAVRAGLALVGSAATLGARCGAAVELRIGIATGLVVIGEEPATAKAKEPTAVGETPDLAYQLQNAAKAGDVVEAETTRRLVGGLFDYRDLGHLPAEGLAEPTRAWQVIGPSSIESRFEALRTGATPLVGREEELELLLRRWRQAQAGDGSVVLLSGEPGIGKSRIAVALMERLSDEPHTLLRSFCSPHHQDTALYPTITQLERAARFRRDDTDERRLDKLEAVLAEATRLSEAVPLLAALLSLPTDGRYPPLILTPQKRKERTLKALLAQMEGLAARQSLLMVVEDAHWIDPTSLELLDLTVERVPSLPVLLIITFRPEFTPPWVGRPQVTLLSLSRLSRRQRTEMISRLIHGKALPTEIAEEIVDRTDGVPLFIEELTKAVVESGELADAGDHYTVTKPLSALTIPATLHASLLARLDRSATVREVAQIGAALGRHFSHELISAVASMPQPQLDDALAQLVSAELIFRRGRPPDAEYTFKHALVQDAAYSTLLRSRRQQLHGRIAATVEGQFPAIAAAYPEVLARNCTEASLHDKVIGYWSRAGDQAVQRASNREAIEHLRRALSLNETRPDTVERSRKELAILSQLGPALVSVYGWPASEVGTAFDRAREVARKLESSVDLAPPLVGLWLFHIGRGQLVQAEQISHELFKIARDCNDDDILMQAHHTAWPTGWVRGKLADAIAHIDAGMDLYDEVRHAGHRFVYMGHDPAVCALSVGATVHWALGQPERGMRLERDARKLAQRLQHPPSLALGLSFVGEAQVARRDVAAAMATAQELLALCDEHRLPQPRATALMFFGWALAHGGDVAGGIRHLEEGLGIWDRLGARVYLARAICLLAEAYLQGGRYADGVKQVDMALATAVEIGDEGYVPKMHIVRASLLAHLGRSNVEAAETSLQQGIAVSRTQGARGWELRASTSLARLWRDQGKRTEARDLLAPIYSSFTHAGPERGQSIARRAVTISLSNDLATLWH
jgi:class 3 adenylate cyclase/predicted ATPase